jgi:hypothetical protein
VPVSVGFVNVAPRTGVKRLDAGSEQTIDDDEVMPRGVR